MKFGPRQFVGLAAIIVFGGILVFTLAKPKIEPFVAPDTPPPPEHMTVHIAEDPLTIGSPEAQDDLYCSGVISTNHRATNDISSPAAQARRDALVALAEAGVARLVAEDSAVKSDTASIADAQADVAEADFRAGTPRISLADCNARAAALTTAPPPT